MIYAVEIIHLTRLGIKIFSQIEDTVKSTSSEKSQEYNPLH